MVAHDTHAHYTLDNRSHTCLLSCHVMDAIYCRVHTSFSDEYSDEWCRDPGNNVRPRLLMQAHTAPLGLEFFGERYPSTPCAALDGSIHYANPVYSDTGTIRNTTGDGDGTAEGGLRDPLDETAFPCSMYGDIFVALHGSWNRPVAVGFSVSDRARERATISLGCKYCCDNVLWCGVLWV